MLLSVDRRRYVGNGGYSRPTMASRYMCLNAYALVEDTGPPPRRSSKKTANKPPKCEKFRGVRALERVPTAPLFFLSLSLYLSLFSCACIALSRLCLSLGLRFPRYLHVVCRFARLFVEPLAVIPRWSSPKLPEPIRLPTRKLGPSIRTLSSRRPPAPLPEARAPRCAMAQTGQTKEEEEKKKKRETKARHRKGLRRVAR